MNFEKDNNLNIIINSKIRSLNLKIKKDNQNKNSPIMMTLQLKNKINHLGNLFEFSEKLFSTGDFVMLILDQGVTT